MKIQIGYEFITLSGDHICRIVSDSSDTTYPDIVIPYTWIGEIFDIHTGEQGPTIYYNDKGEALIVLEDDELFYNPDLAFNYELYECLYEFSN